MANFKISKLQVTNFRNLCSDIVSFGPGINCIFGNNGNGKTNLLEAIYVLINHRSFRKNTTFPQLLGMDGDKPEILFSSAFQDNQENLLAYSGMLSQERSFWHLNEKPIKKKINVPVVFINPFDSYNFFHSPQFRRHFVDYHLCLLSPAYRENFKKFSTSLKFHNKLLSTRPPQYQHQIEALRSGIAETTFQLVTDRKKFLEELQGQFVPVFQRIFEQCFEPQIDLISNFKGRTAQQIGQIYQQNLPRDQLAGHLTGGAHRDDYQLLLDGMNFEQYASLGQQKSAFLGLTFAYIELFRYKFNTYPIVLIDDISGELDEVRWHNLISYLKACHYQVLITTANENFKEELEKIEQISKLKINAGSIVSS
ncbi:MAG: DNA replication and repair protein RecF [Pseudomonadota bacterium]